MGENGEENDDRDRSLLAGDTPGCEYATPTTCGVSGAPLLGVNYARARRNATFGIKSPDNNEDGISMENIAPFTARLRLWYICKGQVKSTCLPFQCPNSFTYDDLNKQFDAVVAAYKGGNVAIDLASDCEAQDVGAQLGTLGDGTKYYQDYAWVVDEVNRAIQK